MDLLLWRHAQAEDLKSGQLDIDRALTAKGEKQAKRMAQWLERQLPETARVCVSPARRTVQTADALGRPYKRFDELLPNECASQGLLDLVRWPSARQTVLVIGHQPMLGQVVARLLGLQAAECAIRKGALWWLRCREVDDVWQTTLLTVQTPDLM